MSRFTARSLLFFLAVAATASGGAATPKTGENTIFDPSCWHSVLGMSTCIKDLPTFFTTFPFHLSAECCDAIHAIDGDCFKITLPLPVPVPQIGDIVDGFAAAYCPKKFGEKTAAGPAAQSRKVLPRYPLFVGP